MDSLVIGVLSVLFAGGVSGICLKKGHTGVKSFRYGLLNGCVFLICILAFLIIHDVVNGQEIELKRILYFLGFGLVYAVVVGAQCWYMTYMKENDGEF